MYTTEKKKNGSYHLDEVAAAEQAVLTRQPHDYDSFRYLIGNMLPLFCCCFKSKEWYKSRGRNHKKNKAVMEGLSAQLDIIDILRWFRIFKFVSIISLRKNQAQLVKYFKVYCLEDEDSKIEDVINQKDIELDNLMRGFNPKSDRTDRIMLYMLIGQNVDNTMIGWLENDEGTVKQLL